MSWQKQTRSSAGTGKRGYNKNLGYSNHIPFADPVQTILDRLENVKPMGVGKWSARCPDPAHDDRRNSLSISRGHDGRALVYCHAGCETREILRALGMSHADLFADGTYKSKLAHNSQWKPGTKSITKTKSAHVRRDNTPGEVHPEKLIDSLQSRLGTVSARWEYQDVHGTTCGCVLRWDLPNGTKDIRPVSRGMDGLWRIGAMPEPRPLYRLPRLRKCGKDETIYVTEGEKAADALVSIGLVATTSSGGAKAPQKTDWTPLADLHVTIWPDFDKAGFQYAQAVAKILSVLSPVVTVKILDPTHFNLKEKQDAADYVARQKGGAA